jgi:hypothetical protein
VRHISRILIVAMTIAFAYAGTATAGETGTGNSQVVDYLKGVLAQKQAVLANAQAILGADSADLASLSSLFNQYTLELSVGAGLKSYNSRRAGPMLPAVQQSGATASLVQKMSDLEPMIEAAKAAVASDQRRVGAAEADVAAAQADLDEAESQGE